MTDSLMTWTPRVIDPLGLAVDFNAAWSVETVVIPGGAVVRQYLPNGAGEIFVRYGDDETVERFIAIQHDAVTTVTVSADEAATIAGYAARRVTMTAERPAMRVYDVPEEGGFVDQHRPARVRRIVVYALSLETTPVLIGYDVTSESLAALQSMLDHFLASVAG